MNAIFPEYDVMSLLPWSVVIGASLAAAIFDVRKSRIPNALCGLVWLAGMIFAIVHGGFPGALGALGGCLLLAFPYLLLFIYGGGGAGDAKLTGAIGTWLGVTYSLVTLAAISLAGVILALIYALCQKRMRRVLANLAGAVNGILTAIFGRGQIGDVAPSIEIGGDKNKMPYGPAIFIGVCIAAIGVFLWTH